MEKDGLPRYSPIDEYSVKRHHHFRRSKALKVIAVACLAFVAYAQWMQLRTQHGPRSGKSTILSVERLQADLATCAKLQSKPKDPTGPRERNARYIEGSNPTLIRNATIWTGEPVAETTAEEAIAGKGYSWTKSDVLLQYGLIVKVGAEISEDSLPEGCQVFNAGGRQLTAGIVDMHSHAGVGSLPSLRGGSDTNELSSDITPYVRSIDGLNVLDPQIQVIKSGGVTTSLVLPGSGNNIGGEAFVIKLAVGKPDGRLNISNEDMLADPERNWRYMKMACGENAKNVYGERGHDHGPFSRLGEAWQFRHAFEEASNLVKTQDDWCAVASANGVETMDSYLPQELQWESLGAALRGQVHINTHCYTVADLEAFVRHTNEFKFPVRAFHHAHQTYLVPEVLKRAWGGRPPAAALFADNMYYKVESYIGSEQAGKILYENGITPVYVSDNPVLNAQHVVFEAAKAYKYGLPYHAALASVTTAPAELMGLQERIGKIKAGFDADVVVWDDDPLAVGAAPVQVWIDGTAQFPDPYELDKPLSEPITPDEHLHESLDKSIPVNDVVFTGVSKVLVPGFEQSYGKDAQSANVVISNGRIVCQGPCSEEVNAASSSNVKIVSLNNGYLTSSFTSIGSSLGLEEIASEGSTQDGKLDNNAFSRAIDGLALDNKQLAASYSHGVTKAISAPQYQGGGSRGVSAGFRTGALQTLEKGGIFAEELSLHYTLSLAAKQGNTPSISSAIGALRHKLLEAAVSSDPSDQFSEPFYLKKVVNGSLPLAVDVDSADTIAALLRMKSEVESLASTTLRVIVIGGAESHLVASELAAANVGVVLAPLQPYASSWDQRRSLTGAPLTNGTTVDVLLDAGVTIAIGTDEDWEVRDLGLMAGIAYKNGGGRLSEKGALDLVSGNVYKMLGVESLAAEEEGLSDFVVWEGNPLEIEGRVRAVGGGMGVVTVFE